MEEKELTPQESMEVIAQMMKASKQRIALPDLRVSVVWAVLSIAVAAVVLTVSLIAYTPWINLLWFAIPVIGLPVSLFWAKRSGIDKGAKTVIDNISDGIWKTVGVVAVVLTAICLVFNLCGYTQAWLAMFYFAFIVVGFGAAMQGIVLKEGSYVVGGLFSIIAGFVLISLNLCHMPLLIVWVLPLYIACFLMMFVMPAIIIRRKINSGKI